MVQAIDVTTGLDSRQLRNGSIGNQKVGVQVGKGGRVGKGERKRTKEMDELSFEGGWVATNAVKNFAYPNRSLTAEANRGSSVTSPSSPPAEDWIWLPDDDQLEHSDVP
jgi:hypothetical protein